MYVVEVPAIPAQHCLFHRTLFVFVCFFDLPLCDMCDHPIRHIQLNRTVFKAFQYGFDVGLKPIRDGFG